MYIDRYDASKLSQKPFVVIVTGKRASGKSVLVKDMMYHLHKTGFPRTVVFSPTNSSNGHYSAFVPAVYVHDHFNQQLLGHIYAQQKELVLRANAKVFDAEIDTRLLLVLDDVAFDRKTLASETFKEIIFNSRHYNISVVITLQYLIALPCALRSQVDIGIFLRENNLQCRNRINTTFLGSLKAHEFDVLFGQCTEGYKAIVVDNAVSGGTKLEDTVFYYLADPVCDFRFGSTEFWTFHDRYYFSQEEKLIQRIQEEEQRKHDADHDVGDDGSECEFFVELVM